MVSYFALMRLGFIFPIQLLPAVLCWNVCESAERLHPDRLSNGNVKDDVTTEAIATLLPSNFNHDNLTVLIEKANYRLTVFYDMQPIKSYPVVFGDNPVGDKRYEGDRKTPEGIFFIRDRYPHPAWSKFLWLNYPTPQAWREHFQAKAAGDINWLMPIGGEIGIHGVPNNNESLINVQSNWTWGCPSMKNEDVDELYDVVQVGTLVEILP
ncbi:MAG: L,D-transpeptidase [Cyanobacteria bacterium P01_F01_bin.150]